MPRIKKEKAPSVLEQKWQDETTRAYRLVQHAYGTHFANKMAELFFKYDLHYGAVRSFRETLESILKESHLTLESLERQIKSTLDFVAMSPQKQREYLSRLTQQAAEDARGRAAEKARADALEAELAEVRGEKRKESSTPFAKHEVKRARTADSTVAREAPRQRQEPRGGR